MRAEEGLGPSHHERRDSQSTSTQGTVKDVGAGPCTRLCWDARTRVVLRNSSPSLQQLSDPDRDGVEPRCLGRCSPKAQPCSLQRCGVPAACPPGAGETARDSELPEVGEVSWGEACARGSWGGSGRAGGCTCRGVCSSWGGLGHPSPTALPGLKPPGWGQAELLSGCNASDLLDYRPCDSRGRAGEPTNSRLPGL